MTAPVFVDTNVLVYRYDISEPEKQRRCEDWLDVLWDRGAGRLSIQVQQELYATLTRKLDRPLGPADARAVVRSLFAWDPVPIDRTAMEGAWRLQERYSLSWWDALIVAAAQVAGCSVLLSEDLGHGASYDGVRVVNPVETTPDELVG